MSVGLILGKMPEDCNDCKIVIHNEEEFRCPLCPYYDFAGFDSMVPPDECPLQEVEPVRHGIYKMIVDNGCWFNECSVCGNRIEFGYMLQPYCPNCGAKMDRGTE